MSNPDLLPLIEQALRNVFGENVDSRRFIDTTKIPFICKDIEGIHKYQEDLNEQVQKGFEEINKKLDSKFVTKDQFDPIKTVVYGGIGLILVTVLASLLYLVIKQ